MRTVLGWLFSAAFVGALLLLAGCTDEAYVQFQSCEQAREAGAPLPLTPGLAWLEPEAGPRQERIGLLMPAWIGHAAAYAFDVAAWFFIISFVVLPVLLAMWRKREKQRAADTEATLKSLGFDHTHRFEQDAL